MNESNLMTARVLRASEPYKSAQGPVYAAAISAETVGSTKLFFGIVTLPPGERTRAHVHAEHESAFYVLSGEAELWSGQHLQQRSVARAGDYLFIPANVPHVAVNRGAAPAVLIGARDDPMAQESVVMRPELDDVVP